MHYMQAETIFLYTAASIKDTDGLTTSCEYNPVFISGIHNGSVQQYSKCVCTFV